METLLPSQPNKLDIPCEAIRGHVRKDLASHLSLEKLETTLCIFDTARPCHLGKEVEHLPHQLPVSRLSREDPRSDQRPTTKNKLSFSKCSFQLWQVFDRSGKVCVRHKNLSSATLQHTMANRGTLSPIAIKAQDSDSRGLEFPGHLDRTILATIIDDQDFEREIADFEKRDDLSQ